MLWLVQSAKRSATVIAVTGALLVTGAAGSGETGLATQCEPVATLVFAECKVEIVSRCEGLPKGWRLYEEYLDGDRTQRQLREDGVFVRVSATATMMRYLAYRPGMLARLLAIGPGGTEERKYAVEITTGGKTTEEVGHQTVRHDGSVRLDLASGPVDAVIITTHADLEDGRTVRMKRFYDPVLGVLMGSDWLATFPGRPAVKQTEQVLWRLLPGDVGFGVTEPPQTRECGSAS